MLLQRQDGILWREAAGKGAEKMKILFQGDSITDAGRDRENRHDLGKGYPLYAAEYIRKANPDKAFEFIDLGISGNPPRWQTARRPPILRPRRTSSHF